MEYDEMHNFLTRALETAKMLKTVKDDNALKWMISLTRSFEDKYADYVVRSRQASHSVNKKEYLTDISVIKYNTILSHHAKKPINYVNGLDYLWAVESEFSNSETNMAFDFSKLNGLCAKKKLFIGPHVKKPEKLFANFNYAASPNASNFYFALVPHPRNWTKGNQEIILYRHNSN